MLQQSVKRTTPWNTHFGESSKYYICKSVLVG